MHDEAMLIEGGGHFDLQSLSTQSARSDRGLMVQAIKKERMKILRDYAHGI